MFDVSAYPDPSNAEEALKVYAQSIRPHLQSHWIAGDGNCLYRSVAKQLPGGEGHHQALRAGSTQLVIDELQRYIHRFPDHDPDLLTAWANQMKCVGHWGDDTSVRLITDYIRRPVLVWRLANPNQPPSCFVPVDHAALGQVRPVYIRLDERNPGSEHYTALLPSPPHPAAAAKAEAAPPAKRRKQEKPPQAERLTKSPTLAEQSNLKGWDAIGDWGKHGLTQAQYEKLLSWMVDHKPFEAMDKLHLEFPELSLPAAAVHNILKMLDHWCAASRREAAAKDLEIQKQALQQIQAGNTNPADLRRAHPGVGRAFLAAALGSPTAALWHEEFLRRFSQAGPEPAQNTEWPTHAEAGNTLPTKAQSWMRTPAWTFCKQCGHHELHPDVAWQWSKQPNASVQKACSGGCDLEPEALQQPLPEPPRTNRLKAYVTPQQQHWQAWVAHIDPEAKEGTPLHAVLSKKDMEALAPLELRVDFATRRGGKATITSRQKQSLVRARWKLNKVEENFRQDGPGKRAFEWLMDNNSTYAHYVNKHKELLREGAVRQGNAWVPTAELLLRLPGLEVAARPWLYPYAAFGDTDLAARLKELKQIGEASTPSLKTSWLRKVCCRCMDFALDHQLHCFLYDVSLARTLSSVVNLAEQKKMAPETFAAEMAAFEMYWHRQTQLLEDICRRAKRLPELFFTLAPAEWKFPLHEGMFPPKPGDTLTSQQLVLTLHLYNSLQAVLRKLVFENGEALKACGIKKINHWCMRFEFQKRGTIHVHVICWYRELQGRHPAELTGRTGEKHTSPLVKLLEETFQCSVDAQGGNCSHNLLNYVLGYVAKASDALQFRTKDGKCTGKGPQEDTRWRQIYRMLSKKAPLEQAPGASFSKFCLGTQCFLIQSCHIWELP